MVFLNSCEVASSLCSDDELTISRIDYSGSQLKIDGYYFGDANPNSSKPFANIYYLYRNGVFFTTGASDLDKAETGTITVDVNNEFGKRIKGLWGVFRINGSTIEIERWQSSPTCATTVYERGDILNDTTFIITQREYRSKGKVVGSENPKSTFHFRSLTQKPDSVNTYVR